MEPFIISFIIILAVTFVGGPLGWGIVLTAVLYFVFETVSSSIQKSQKKMRREMDLILKKNDQVQNKIEEFEKEEEDDDTIEGEATPESDEIASNSMPENLSDITGQAPTENTEAPQEDGLVDRVDAAAGVLDALEQREQEKD